MTLFAQRFYYNRFSAFVTQDPYISFQIRALFQKFQKKKQKTSTCIIQNFLYFRTFLLIQSNISQKIGKKNEKKLQNQRKKNKKMKINSLTCINLTNIMAPGE